MRMRVATWQQDQFITPGRNLYRWPGDFYSLSVFIPSRDSQSLERAPGWSSHIEYPSGFDAPRAITYDAANDRFVVVGTLTVLGLDYVGTFGINHDDLSKTSTYSTGDLNEPIAGTHKLNARQADSGFYYIDNTGDLNHASSPYGVASATLYGGGDAAAFLPIRDTIYLITTDDKLKRYDASGPSWDTLIDPDITLGLEFLYHFRNDIILLAYDDDGSAVLYRVWETPPTDIEEIARLAPHTAQRLPDDANAQWSSPWCVFHEDLYFSPGAWIRSGDAFEAIPIYRYNGSKVELVDTVDSDITPHAWGLLSWRDRLLLYVMDNAHQDIYALHRGRFTEIIHTGYQLPSDADLYSAGGELLMVTNVTNDGIHVSEGFASNNRFTSSWLDMGHPASKKHLVRLACVVSDAATDFDVTIDYRTESGSWTEAVKEDDARHVDVGDLGVDFYLLQLRVTFADGTGNDEDFTLESVAATYTYGVP